MTGWEKRNDIYDMKWICLHSSTNRHPSIFDKDIRCDYCGNNHIMDDNGRIRDLDLIGTSTAGMTLQQAAEQGADLAVKSNEVIEFYRHK